MDKVRSAAEPPLRLGILGGTFDPIHEGHLHIAREAFQALKLHKILLIPANLSPFKLSDELTPAFHRLEMVKRAAAGDPALEVSDLDIKRGGVSYMVDTLQVLQELYPPETLFFLILGADAFLYFDSWKDAAGLRRRCTVAVAGRPDYSLETSRDVVRITKEMLPFSATEIRQGLRSNPVICPKGLAEGVFRYIQMNSLYSKG